MTCLLTDLCSIQTAPFAEGHVIAFLEQFVAARPPLKLSRDQFGNLLIELPGRRPTPRWVFAAHMDHPGLYARKMIGSNRLRARFFGGVMAEYVKGSKVTFFDPADANRTTHGVVRDLKPPGDDGSARGADVIVNVDGPVAARSPGMFAVGGGRVRGKRFYSRVCDNLAGAAAALAMLDALLKRRTPTASSVAVLLTRAEEEGFIGAIAAIRDGTLLRKDDRLVVIECSAAQPFAPLGGGCVIRVGDRTSVFNSAVSYFLTEQAAKLAKTDPAFRFQRALMPGGTCEATVYDAFGYTAGSVCVPLGNYHNMDKRRRKVAAEFIDVNDWQNMVKLFVAVARNGHTFTADNQVLQTQLSRRFEKMRAMLKGM